MMATYKPGQVSASLFSSSKKKGSKDDGLAKLFSSTKIPSPADIPKQQSQAVLHRVEGSVTNSIKENNPPLEPQQIKQKKKRKKELLAGKAEKVPETTTVAANSTSSAPFPYAHETLAPKKSLGAAQKSAVKRKLDKDTADDGDPGVKRPRRDRKRDKQADKRTIFVGNCPLTADKKRLRKLFREYGEIDTVRFRCAPAAEPNLPRRAIVITKNFHEKCNNYVAYIVFKEEEAAKKALERNGYLLDDLHIRVDIAAMAGKHDKKRSVFVGNLPFTIREEEIRSHFSDCGEIVNVRIVRDRMTSLGKGISYVQFESKDSVNLALKLNKSELQGRQLRVMVCTNKPQKKEEKKTVKKAKPEKSTKDGKKKISFAPSNATNSSFKTILKVKRDKRFRKMKKKKENAKKSDGLSSIFGDVPSPAKKMKLGKTKSDRQGKQALKKRPRQKGNSFKGKGKGKKSKH